MADEPQNPEANPTVDRADTDVSLVKKRLSIAAGVIGFLMSTIGPAISFDITLGMGDDFGVTYLSYFTLLAGGIFLLCWRFFNQMQIGILVALGLLSTISFIGYSITRYSWSCPYPYADNASRIVTGTSYLEYGKRAVRIAPELRDDCTKLLESAGGDAAKLFQWPGLIRHFLVLYAVFSVAWLSLAAFLLAAARRSLNDWRP